MSTDATWFTDRLALASAEIAALREANARLRELLRDYGRHNEGCDAQFGDRYRCRCGWREAQKEAT